MANILLLETATEVCSVALSVDGKVVAHEEDSAGGRHSSLLTLFIEKVLMSARLEVSHLDAVCVSSGPGSYTGLRIGVSAAKGICYALEIPLLAVSTLNAMAAEASRMIRNGEDFSGTGIIPQPGESFLLCPMIDARRMEVYTALYDSMGNLVTDIAAMVIDENSFAQELSSQRVFFFGNGAAKCREVISHHNALFNDHFLASARFMSGVAEERYGKKEFENLPYFEPFYLKDFIATIPRNKIF